MLRKLAMILMVLGLGLTPLACEEGYQDEELDEPAYNEPGTEEPDMNSQRDQLEREMER